MSTPNLLTRWFRPRAAARSALAAVASEPWLVQPKQLEAAFAEIREGAKAFTAAADVRAAMEMADGEAEAARANPYHLEDGVAFIPIHGLIMRDVPCAMRFFGTAATSTIETQAAIAQALDDDEVQAIFLDVNSPGGTLSGTAELADDVRAARDIKPVYAHVSDLAASAAYWIAAQATQVTAGKTAQIGSIGVFRVLVDSSKKAEDAGLKVHRLASGPDKGVGVDGVEITEDQLKVEQELVDRAASLFQEAVLAGRPALDAEALAKMATGRVWFGADALSMGLVDAVQSTSDAFAQVSALVGAGPTNNTNNTDEDNGAPQGAGGDMANQNPAASTGIEERLAALEQENSRLKAQIDLRDKGLGDRRKAVLDKHQMRGAFDPADRPEYERIAEAAYGSDPDGLDSYLTKLESKSHRDPKGSLGENAPNASESSYSAETLELARAMNLSAQDLADAEDTVSFSMLGNERVTKSGTVVPLFKEHS